MKLKPKNSTSKCGFRGLVGASPHLQLRLQRPPLGRLQGPRVSLDHRQAGRIVDVPRVQTEPEPAYGGTPRPLIACRDTRTTACAGRGRGRGGGIFELDEKRRRLNVRRKAS